MGHIDHLNNSSLKNPFIAYSIPILNSQPLSGALELIRVWIWQFKIYTIWVCLRSNITNGSNVVLRRFLNISLIYFCVKLWTPSREPVLDWGHSFYNLESSLFEDPCKIISQIKA